MITPATSAYRLQRALDRVLRPLELAAAIVAGVMMCMAMLLVAFDALLRYAFAAPIGFAYYFTTNYLMVGMVTMALAWGYRTGGYIRVSLLTALLPAGARQVLLRIGLLASAAYMALLAWTSFEYAVEAFRTNQIYIADINWPIGWSWVWIPIGCGLLTLRLLLIAFGPAVDLHVQHNPEEAT